MNEIDRLSNWIWNVDKKRKYDPEKPKGIAQYDQWVNYCILDGVGDMGALQAEEFIDKRLSLLREWILLLRHRGNNGQVVLHVFVYDRFGKRRSITHDIRDFSAYCRYKEKNYGDSALAKILL